uniref:Ku70/Ku80 N-terminal alpha/beta domain-containing protein n=1 Tax=Hucho hucho TaxID=62062 RepID=A0A4W5KFC8_9TELE
MCCHLRLSFLQVFAENKDELGLVLFGSDNTENNLAKDGQYQNISVHRHLMIPNFELLEEIQNAVHPGSQQADWLDALVVCMDLLQNETLGKKYERLNIVLLTDLNTPSSPDQLDIIIGNLKRAGITLQFLCVYIYICYSTVETSNGLSYIMEALSASTLALHLKWRPISYNAVLLARLWRFGTQPWRDSKLTPNLCSSSLPFPVDGGGSNPPHGGKGLSREQQQGLEMTKQVMMSLDEEDGLEEVYTFR